VLSLETRRSTDHFVYRIAEAVINAIPNLASNIKQEEAKKLKVKE
jgi:hypothetical protein